MALGSVPPEALLASFPAALLRREDASNRVLQNFELFGSIGHASYVQAHTEERVADAGRSVDCQMLSGAAGDAVSLCVGNHKNE